MMPTVSIDLLPLPVLTPVLAAVAAAALKGALLVALAALVATTVLRHRPAAVRHAVWTGALAANLLLIATAPFVPGVSVPGFRLPAWLTASTIGEHAVATPSAEPHEFGPTGVVPPGSGRISSIPTAMPGEGLSAASGAGVTPSPSASGSVSASTRPAPSQAGELTSSQAGNLTRHLTALWLLGVLLVLSRLLLGTARVLTLARAAERITDAPTLGLAQRTASRLGIVRPITLLRGDRLSIPITWGVVYPTVLLPASSDEWPDERRRVVLVHEMAHVKRFDALTQLVAQVALAIFWFDPLVWLAARRMRAEREHACDDYVLRDGTRPSLYANELLDMVRRLAGRAGEAGAPAFAALAMARRSEFEGRMVAILDPAADRQALSRRGMVACGLGLIALLLPLAALRPFEAQPLDTPHAGSLARAPTTTVLTLPAPRGRATTEARSSARAATASAQASGSAGGAAQEKLPIMYRCTQADVRSTNNTHSIHTDHERPGRNFVEYYVKKYGRCLHAVFAGRVAFTADERDIASLSPDGRVQLHERTLDWERTLVVTSGDGGELRRAYSANGRPAAYDASAQAWVAGLIRDLARESGIEVPRRVSRIRARGGVAAVLAEIGEIQSSGAKGKHYKVLLEAGDLTAAEIDGVVRHAGRELAGSSGDLRAVLRLVPRGGVRAIDAALEEAIARMSDGDKRQVLAGMLDGADGPTLLVVMRLAERIGSDGDKSGLLRRAAPRVLDGSASSLREAFFRTFATLGSDGDKHAVLVAAVRQGQRSSALTRDVIRAAGRIGSDGDKAAVLLVVARNGMVTTTELREEYIKTARTIGSDGDYRAVIDAVLGGKPGA